MASTSVGQVTVKVVPDLTSVTDAYKFMASRYQSMADFAADMATDLEEFNGREAADSSSAPAPAEG